MAQNDGHPDGERRTDSLTRWCNHVDQRLDSQDALLQEIRDKLGAAKFIVTAIAWVVGVGAALLAIWGKMKGIG